jgi:hypothetical protein
MGLDVRLRAVRDDDLPIFFEHQRDPEANRMASFDARDEAPFLAHRAKILRDGNVVVRTIEIEGRDVGATAALTAFLGELNTRPLHAHVATHNIGSVRALEKCGFERTGPRTTASDGVEELLLELAR